MKCVAHDVSLRRPHPGGQASRLLPVLVCGGALLLAVTAAAEPKLTFIDLQPKANHRLVDDLGERMGNNLANVPRGEQKLGDATFNIGEKLIRLRGIRAADLPAKVEGIPVETAF